MEEKEETKKPELNEKQKTKLKDKFNIENFLCLFILMCPVLDMVSFLFRNVFNTNFSPSTFTRPLIPAILMICLFFKNGKKFKINSIIVGLIYVIYAIVHIFLFTKVKSLSSYSNEIHEAQYLVNYSFMILNLFVYIYVFKDKNMDKLRKFMFIASAIYIVSIFIAILTNTSSSTYIEKMGYKGWFESGNSVCAILLLSMFIYIPLLRDKKYRIWVALNVILNGIFLTMFVGTRVGLYGFILVIGLYVITEIVQEFLKNKKLNKKITIIGIVAIATIIAGVTIFGSTTLQRRKHLQDIEQNIVDESKNEQAHITGSLMEIKEKIDNGTLEEGYLNEAQKQSIIDLYNIANDMNVTNNDQRMQQLIYNIVLVKNQANTMLIVFGNGYMANYRELVFEMEVPAILINFGIMGFVLYLGPFIVILGYALYKGIKKFRKIDADYIRLILGSGFAFALSFFSGYTFFSPSTALIIVVLSAILFSKAKNLDKEV